MIKGMLVSIELDGADRLVVAKRATDPAAASRLTHEMAVLKASRHPGVVDLLATADDGGAPALITRWVGPRTLAAATGLPLANAAATMAAIADVVADLHEIGLVHGRLDGEHVLIAADGRPVLCGFGEATWRSHEATEGVTTATDVGALGGLLRALAGDVELEPIPDRRGWRRPRWLGYQRRALLTLADQATHDDPSMRPSARSFAASIHKLMPDAHLEPPPSGGSTGWRTATTTGAAAPDLPKPVRPAAPDLPKPAGTAPAPAPLRPDGGSNGDRPEGIAAKGRSATAGDGMAGGSAEALSPAWSPFVASHPIGEVEPADQPARTAGRVSVLAERAADRDVTGEFQLTPPDEPVAPAPERWPSLDGKRLRRAIPVLAAALGLVLLLLGVAQLRDRSAPVAIAHRKSSHGRAPAPAPTKLRAPSAAAPRTTARAPSPVPRNSGSRRPGPTCAPVSQPSADLDGDGCPEAVRIDHTGVVANGVRYAVGQAGDRVAVGDWDCDGRATPAVLRPATGEVFVFPRWAPSQRPLTIGPSATVAEAKAIAPSPLDARGCADLQIRTAAGQVTVPVER